MSSPSSKLQTVIDHLPFPVDDTEAANDVFRRWEEHEDPTAEYVISLWTYCYVCRYFLAKAAGDAFDKASAPDELITRAYRKVEKNRDEVRNPDRYASWVSVICKNTFLNYVRRDRFSESIERDGGPELCSGESRPVADVGFVRETVDEAINQLPEYLQEPARLYFLEDREYEEVSEEVGKPVATVRAYKHKAVKQLRSHEKLREYVEQPDL